MFWQNWIFNLIIALLLQSVLLTNAAAHGLKDQAVLIGSGGDFTLQSAEGPVTLEQLRGKVVLIFFGYTSCPDVCPATLAVISNVFSKLDARELENVTALFVSLDPEKDTPELLQKYTDYFHPNIIGVTDHINGLNQVTERYGVVYERSEKASSPIGYVINHTLDILVINQEGKLLETRIQPATSAKEILAYLRNLVVIN